LSLTFEFCDARAQEAARAANSATLDNVREQARRSEAVWREMADRLQQRDEGRKLSNAVRAETQS